MTEPRTVSAAAAVAGQAINPPTATQKHAVYATASAMLVVCLLGSHVLAMPSDAHGESRGGSGASSEEVPIITVPERGGLFKKRSPTESPELDDAE